MCLNIPSNPWYLIIPISSSWLLALPGPHLGLSNEEFVEAAANNLCLPSPACLDRLGETVRGNKKIDLNGDNVQSAPLPGDHWRKRHDLIKNTLHQLCNWSNLPCEVEVFNLFSRCIPQEGLSRIEKDRDRQGLVPDLKVSMCIQNYKRHKAGLSVVTNPIFRLSR